MIVTAEMKIFGYAPVGHRERPRVEHVRGGSRSAQRNAPNQNAGTNRR